ncbi:CRISPR-associated endoribonuclease Cas2, subtype TIGR01873 [Leptospira weilii serovar Ranarum str. ICFT]|uniref:CRISPR-associated endoribonuclease Cas2, subtype TIGR01873 n=1 Tax=Leptospira weilii serovar Ranarum str. ICFT TaxID=1218598 RepID=N1WM95_9LEPT|nr:type I-E CRISPR-associated endoribonuclease Cas2e [Leptospira weilii]EMY78289.1 CRISPR-associated endoribonuclease Cas2, subtype TIGR01873 [Leptospira weilii serovar Ranarum str. ICFT]
MKTSQRGEISRLAIELKPGVFVASVNARVRDQLWKKISEEWKSDAILLYSSNTEQGYGIRSHGDPSREVVDFDGLLLMSKPDPKRGQKDIPDEFNFSNIPDGDESPFSNLKDFMNEKATSLLLETDPFEPT